MSISEDGLRELAGHEGIVQTRYKDTVGVWTIGIGHTRAAGLPDPKTFPGEMSIADVLALYRTDLARYVRNVNKAVKVAVTQTEFDALVSFHFNTGAIASATLVKTLNAGNKALAAEQFMNWIKPKEVIGRRLKEQKLFATGRYSNGGKATLYKANSAGKIDWGSGTTIDLA
jgi:lysozyme